MTMYPDRRVGKKVKTMCENAAESGHAQSRSKARRKRGSLRLHRLVSVHLALAAAVTAADDPRPQSPVLDDRSALTALEQIWQLTCEQVFPPELVATHFGTRTFEDLRRQANALDTVAALPTILNPFLDSLGVSHTQLYAPHDFEYAFFRSLFSTRTPDEPAFSHLGLQLLQESGTWWVRESLDGLPADRAGIRRGDRLVGLDGEAFHPARVCDGGQRTSDEPHRLDLVRGSSIVSVYVSCVRQNPHASMHDAISNSVQTLGLEDGREVGYVRLWTGTGSAGLDRFRAAIAELAETDALILDLRGGFGGAWYEHLDPFFADRQGFFSYTVINREGRTDYRPEPRENPAPYQRPMVVLINEGTRSGKEALAFQFRKSGRAALIGSRTAGAFSAGKGLFVDDAGPLVYYLAVAEYRLDGQQIEGVGVAPDLEVPYPAIVSDGPRQASGEIAGQDPQLAAALGYLARLLRHS
jgi:carboxyl-terminal processing protease